jgi:hypothetical protein
MREGGVFHRMREEFYYHNTPLTIEEREFIG